MNTDQVGGIARTVLGAGGGYLIAKGVDAGLVTALVGAAVTIVTALWSWYTNKSGTVIPAKTA